MTTAGARLVRLAGAGAAGLLWRRAARTAAAGNAGGLLVFRSTLGVNTAAVHHLYDPPTTSVPFDPTGRPLFMRNFGKLMNR